MGRPHRSRITRGGRGGGYVRRFRWGFFRSIGERCRKQSLSIFSRCEYAAVPRALANCQAARLQGKKSRKKKKNVWIYIRSEQDSLVTQTRIEKLAKRFVLVNEKERETTLREWKDGEIREVKVSTRTIVKGPRLSWDFPILDEHDKAVPTAAHLSTTLPGKLYRFSRRHRCTIFLKSVRQKSFRLLNKNINDYPASFVKTNKKQPTKLQKRATKESLECWHVLCHTKEMNEYEWCHTGK